MDDERLPKKMLTGQLKRKRPVGRARTSLRKVIRADLDAIECGDYPAMVLDRKSWKIKGPYIAEAEVAPTRRSLRLAVKSKSKSKFDIAINSSMYLNLGTCTAPCPVPTTAYFGVLDAICYCNSSTTVMC